MHFLEIIKKQQFLEVLKYKAMYGFFFYQIEALLSLKNAWLTPNFLFGYQEHLLSFVSSA